MSRHRIVRTMNYSDDYDGYDDTYSRSVDDDSCISPTDAQQWLYDRARGQHSMSSFIMNNNDIKEEGEHEDEDDSFDRTRRDSDNFQMPKLSDVEQAKLTSCIDEVHNVVGDQVSQRRIVETSMRFGYDITKILDDILNNECDNQANQHEPVAGCSTMRMSSPTTTTSKLPKLIVPERDGTAVQTAGAVKVTTAQTLSERDVQRGFEIPSPKSDVSPAESGRSTPSEDGRGRNQVNFKVSKEQAHRDAQQLYSKERGDQKEHFHMIVIGHVDAGKSTLMGHLLYDIGAVSKRVMHKYEQDSKKLGKQSFMYAWVLDETGEERERGITMDLGQSRIETNTKIVTLLDAPGHKDFIPNMISGATQADVALLVVDASRGEFEAGFEQGGQTREHALLVRSLGVNQLGVVVNKLDMVNWSKERFDEIEKKLKNFLRQAGFKEADVIFVPCSGLSGENLTKPATEPALTSWYQGPYLLNVIDNFRIPERSVDRPFRMSVSDVYKSIGSGFCISGRVETGVLCLNDKVLVGTSREQAQVKLIQIDELSQLNAFAGDQITVTLSGIDINKVTIGCIICDPQNPIPVTTRFQARILLFSLKVPITIGYTVLLHHQSLVEQVIIRKLHAQIHKGTGEIVKKKPRMLNNNMCALVEIEASRPICIERYADFKELGRFMLRVGGVTIAAGMVTKIY